MNRLFWFALGSIGTLTAGLIYLATREEKLATVPTNDSEGFAGIAGESLSTLEEDLPDLNLRRSNSHRSNSLNLNSLDSNCHNSSTLYPNEDGGNDA